MASDTEQSLRSAIVNEQGEFISVFNLSGGNVRVGFTSKGNWVVESVGGLILDIRVLKGSHHTLVLLESSIAEVRETLDQFRSANPVNSEVYDNFPFCEVVAAGLKQGSDYWADLALRWLPELSEKDREKLQNELLEVSKAKWASQKTRQVAARLRKRQ